MHVPGVTNSIRVLLEAGSPINMYSASGCNALQSYTYADYGSEEDIKILLYAAGEEEESYEPESCNNDLSLLHLCRKSIRKHLLSCNPHTHLFARVPLLGLPTILNEYLLFDQTLSLEYPLDDESSSDTDFDYSDGALEECGGGDDDDSGEGSSDSGESSSDSEESSSDSGESSSDSGESSSDSGESSSGSDAGLS